MNRKIHSDSPPLAPPDSKNPSDSSLVPSHRRCGRGSFEKLPLVENLQTYDRRSTESFSRTRKHSLTRGALRWNVIGLIKKIFLDRQYVTTAIGGNPHLQKSDDGQEGAKHLRRVTKEHEKGASGLLRCAPAAGSGWFIRTARTGRTHQSSSTACLPMSKRFFKESLLPPHLTKREVHRPQERQR